MEEKTKSPLEDLPPECKAKLRNLVDNIEVDKVTVSFSIEGRDVNDRKKSAFNALSAHRKDVLEGQGFTLQDAELVRCLLSKQVIKATYCDALDRRLLPNSPGVREELTAVLTAYDRRIVQILGPKKVE